MTAADSLVDPSFTQEPDAIPAMVAGRRDGPAVGDLARASRPDCKAFVQPWRNDATVKLLEICVAPAPYRAVASHKQISYTRMEFTAWDANHQWSAPALVWGTKPVGGEGCKLVAVSELGQDQWSLTGYTHAYNGHTYPAGFAIGDDKWGQTSGASQHAATKMNGRIVGFKTCEGGNVDYWGLVVA